MRVQALIAASLVLWEAAHPQSQDTQWAEVQRIFGRPGATQSGMLKETFPRSDLDVRIGDIKVEPGLGLTSWCAFMNAGRDVIAMGDLVLREKEVEPVMAALEKSGIGVTALHNHLLGELPRVVYMHFMGRGTQAGLAQSLKAALQLTQTPLGPPTTSPPSSSVDWSPVEKIMGRQGAKNGHLISFGVSRAEHITEMGIVIPAFLGVATGINFQISGTRAATTGDFVLISSEVNPVVETLTAHGIAVTAIHSHMLDETPRLFFLHFWGVGNPETLATGLREALDRTNTLK